jgi:hypothetical protein
LVSVQVVLGERQVNVRCGRSPSADNRHPQPIDPQPDRPVSRRTQADTCRVSGCDAPPQARSFCGTHYQRWRTTGETHDDVPIGQMPPPPPGPRRSKGWLSEGYRYVPVPLEEQHLTAGAAYTAEHRLVMARLIGRAFTAEETVHHRNGDRLDNRPENLELWARSQPSGQRVEDLVAHAVSVLERYAPDRLTDGPKRFDLTSEAPGRYDRESPRCSALPEQRLYPRPDLNRRRHLERVES